MVFLIHLQGLFARYDCVRGNHRSGVGAIKHARPCVCPRFQSPPTG
jgi:hypothetical protein